MNTKEEQQEEQQQEEQQQEQENEKVKDISLENYSDCQNEDDEDNLYSLEISKESYDPFREDINRKNEELERFV